MIPLSVPNISGNEWQYIKDCLDTSWVSSVGSYVDQFERVTAEYTGAKYAVATSNGTSAIQIALMLAGVKTNDLVIAPNITFVASINAIKYTGAKPILIDIDYDTWQMDVDLLEDFLINNTFVENSMCFHKATHQIIRAILPVHVLGNICDMDKLMFLANQYNLHVVEDSTEALGSYYKGKHAGTFGLLGTLSYNGNKLITTGGGGMVLTDDEDLAKKAKHLTTQAKAKPDEYFHDEIGYNFRLVNVLAAMGVAQMEQLTTFLKRKSEITAFYNARLSKIEGFVNQKILVDVNPNYWLYTIKIPRAKSLLAHFKNLAIEARPFWVPMNQLPANENDLYFTKTDVSNQIYDTCISLPCSTNITDEQLEIVVKHIEQFYGI
ncbi:MAG TPA: LegC family aminotransferase [Leadbetterella sp.]|nr:LegC family aminotransferase [Leadbetterella sp.]